MKMSAIRRRITSIKMIARDSIAKSYQKHTGDMTEAYTIAAGHMQEHLRRVLHSVPCSRHCRYDASEDERMNIDELLLAAQIYLEALYNVCVISHRVKSPIPRQMKNCYTNICFFA